MKSITYTFFIVVLASCNLNKNSSDKDYCKQELDLLKSSFEYTATFNYELTKDEQFENLQSQGEENICSGLFAMNGLYALPNNDTLEILTVVEKLCEDYVHEGPPQPCVLVRTQRVLINKDSKIYIEGHLTQLDSLKQRIAKVTKDFFIDNQYRPAAFEIDWEKNVPVALKKKVLKNIVDGFLIATNNFVKSEFKKSLCDLNESELDQLTRRILMAISLDYSIPTTPLPNQLETESEIEFENNAQSSSQPLGQWPSGKALTPPYVRASYTAVRLT